MIGRVGGMHRDQNEMEGFGNGGQFGMTVTEMTRGTPGQGQQDLPAQQSPLKSHKTPKALNTEEERNMKKENSTTLQKTLQI